MLYGVSLSIILAILWAVLSGYFDKPLLLGLGAVSILVTLFLAIRMRIVDREAAPFLRLPTLIPFYGWLGGEIAKSNVAVVKASLKPSIDITPRLVRVPVEARSDLARCVFANSITLTPGTVTVEVEEDGFLVHALTPDFTAPEGFADMNAKAANATDGRERTS
ncbi:Na+/H+ antiporter subunit E [Hyphobacterium marinum]|uniref:Na+/H+ antiporter subunit E n=1 Tax=Hyphobacterium marinum TaxID=3116574 RepID=A0ABU7M0S1_9PROT|nr:Na+/H+ antiporter subunit E [Hyphobacterium sp. Y6023]MEE2567365.1 Na+/H+ antiporter subunit E [Hyphobacterium sp. Y6023]